MFVNTLLEIIRRCIKVFSFLRDLTSVSLYHGLLLKLN